MASPFPRRARAALFGALALTASSSGGCDAVYPPDPPPGAIVFPTAVALVPPQFAGDPAPYLLMASSNYDVRYGQGSMQTYRLDAILAAVDACTERPCVDENTLSYLVDEVLIGPHLHSMVVSPRGDRIYAAIRSEANLTWIDVSPEGLLDCEGRPGAGEIESCDLARRSTPVSNACGRTPTVQGDVTGVAAGSVEALTGRAEDAGLDWSMLVHRNGRASLFIDVPTGGRLVPTLVHTLTGLPTDGTNAAFDAANNLVWLTTTIPPGGTMPIRTPTRDIPLIGVSYDTATPACSSAFAAGRIAIRGTDDGLDSRDVAFTAGGRYAHVLSRRTEAVVTLDTEGNPLSAGETLIRDVTPVPFGPARLDAATVAGRAILAVTSFDGQRVTIIDATTGDVLDDVAGLQRPQDVVIDSGRGLAYVADFGDSVLRVIDLRPLATGGAVEVALQIGRITPIRSF